MTSPCGDRAWRWGRTPLLVALAACLAQPSARVFADEGATAAPGPAAVIAALPEPDSFPSFTISARSEVLAPRTEDLGRVASRVVRSDREDFVVNANVAFGKDSAVLRPAASARLAELEKALAARDAGTVTITGHTDDLGSAEHGLELSRRRAAAVRESLSAGLGRHRVVVVGRGEADPVAPNDSEPNRARNRRVEVAFRSGR